MGNKSLGIGRLQNYNLKLYSGNLKAVPVQVIIGKEDDTTAKGLAHRVVLSLITGLEGKGYHIYMDNFYTSPALFTDLKRKGFEACGTIRTNCSRGLSNSFKMTTLEKGTNKIGFEIYFR